MVKKTKKTQSLREEAQASEASKTELLAATKRRRDHCVSGSPSSQDDTLVITNVSSKLSYNALHGIFKVFGQVLRIRLIHHGDTSSNTLYLSFAKEEQAIAAKDGVSNLSVMEENSQVKLMRSSNVADSEDDYCPNVFLEDDAPKRVPLTPTPRWFVAYFRNGRGNFYRAAKYLEREIGRIPEGNIKRYGKGVLVRAKDITQGRMLMHLPCPQEGPFESISPHKTFNNSRGCLYNTDLYEFEEEEILEMCPPSVKSVVKMRGGRDMILMTFHSSHVPDHITIGHSILTVKNFVERPLQCLLCCDFGHSKRNCTNSPRCGRCSAVSSHCTAECKEDPHCSRCREPHQLNSRQCPTYKLEQEIVHLANTQFISLGSARGQLRFRHRKGEKAETFASMASKARAKSAAKSKSATKSPSRTEPAPKKAPRKTTEPRRAPSKQAVDEQSPTVHEEDSVSTVNRFGALEEDNGEGTTDVSQTETTTVVVVTADVHAAHDSPKRPRSRRNSGRSGKKSSQKRSREACSSPDSSQGECSSPPTKVVLGTQELAEKDCSNDASSLPSDSAEVNHTVETSVDTPIGKEASTEAAEPIELVRTANEADGTDEAPSGYAKAAAHSPKSPKVRSSVQLPTPKSGGRGRVPITAPGTPKPSEEVKSRLGLLNIRTKIKGGPAPLRRAEWK